MIVIRRTLLSNMNDHRTVIIQYYFASNSEWLFSFYFSVIFSLFTLADYEEYRFHCVLFFIVNMKSLLEQSCNL